MASIASGQSRSSKAKGDLIDRLKDGYDKRVRPNFGRGRVEVGITAFVLAIHDIDDNDHSFKIDMYFRQFWNDPRLRFDPPTSDLQKLILEQEDNIEDFLWKPDTFIVNSKSSPSNVEAPFRSKFLRIMPNGDVLYSTRVMFKASCPMNFMNFPFDSQLCYLEIESFSFTMNDIRYKWNDGENSVQISADVSTPMFKVIGHRTKTIEASLSTGNYSRLALEMQFARFSSWHVLVYLVPMCNLTLVALLVPFSLSGRIRIVCALIMNCVTIGLAFAINANVPMAVYTKLIDIFTGISVTFTFIAFVYCVFASMIVECRVGGDRPSSQSKRSKRIDVCSALLLLGLYIAFLVVYISYAGAAASGDHVEDLIHVNSMK